MNARIRFITREQQRQQKSYKSIIEQPFDSPLKTDTIQGATPSFLITHVAMPKQFFPMCSSSSLTFGRPSITAFVQC